MTSAPRNSPRVALIAVLVALSGCPAHRPAAPQKKPITGAGCGHQMASPPPSRRFEAYTADNGVVLVRSVDSEDRVVLSEQVRASSDGRYIVKPATHSLYVNDVETGKDALVSITVDGRFATAPSRFTPTPASISANGRFVAFDYPDSNLVAHDTNGVFDVFVRDLENNTTVRASVAGDGTEANGESGQPSISSDGRFVAFVSSATNLVPGDTNGVPDVFVRDIAQGRTLRASLDSSNGQTAGARAPEGPNAAVTFERPLISLDGDAVAFSTNAALLGPKDSNDSADIYVRYLGARRTIRANERSGGGQANSAAPASAGFSISQDGTCIAFASSASNLTPGDSNSGIFVKDVVDKSTRRVSIGLNGEALNVSAAALFPDATAVAFIYKDLVYLRDLISSTTVSLGPVNALPIEPAASCSKVAVVGTPPVLRPSGKLATAGVTHGGPDRNGVWVYSVALDRDVEVLEETAWPISDPRFRDARHVTFSITGGRAGNLMCELDLLTKTIREVLRGHEVISSDWSKDGPVLAFMEIDGGRVRLETSNAGRAVRTIADLGPWLGGHDLGEDDENMVTWSPDGHNLLISATGAGVGGGTLFVFDAAGKRLARVRKGTFGRWLPDGSIIFRDRSAPPYGRGRWFRLDISTDIATPLAMQPGTVRPAISPDGRFVAYDDAAGEASLLLFDLRSGAERRLARGYVDAFWLASDAISALEVLPCSKVEHPCISDPAHWDAVRGTRTRIEVSSGHKVVTALHWDWSIDLLTGY